MFTIRLQLYSDQWFKMKKKSFFFKFQERVNKMNTQTLVQALSPTLRTSHRLLTALLYHCRSLFPNTILSTYKPPLSSGAQLPNDLESLEKELLKQESLLSQIHQEMNEGIFIRPRQELLWEVQRMITQLKVNLSAVRSKHSKSSLNLTLETTHHYYIFLRYYG